MATSTQEWKRLNLSKNDVDLSGCPLVKMEHDDGSFLSATFTLKNGSTVRIRKADYGVTIETPVVPMETKYRVTNKKDIDLLFDSESRAEEFIEKLGGSFSCEINKIEVIAKQKALENKPIEDLPF